LKKNVENETKIHYLFIESKNLTRYKQHFKFHSKFKPQYGHQMVNIESLVLYSDLKSELKCNKTNTNKVYSFTST
jgi:hypothetical protein